MKISLRHWSAFVIFLTITCSFSYAQNTLEGYIFDEISKKPLSYAAILIGDTGVYTTSNEDGKFEIFSKKRIDSIEIRYLGYKTTKVSVNYFRSEKIFYLKQFTAILDEVILIGANSIKKTSKTSRQSIAYLKEERPYKLLYNIIKKYRKNKKISDSKAYFTLNSKVDTIPIEQIEGFYNSKQQLSKGVSNLVLKTGRFGQNSLFPFYSLNYISILQNFNLFSKNNAILPQHVGNMSLNKIKKRYHLKFTKTQNYNGTIICFEPKTKKNDIFSGKIFFQEKSLTIEKVELFINNPKSFKLSSIVKNDSISINSLKLNISFNPVDLTKIQYYGFNLDMIYYTGAFKSNITSNIMLYLYDYNTSFTKPYFTNTIYFANDYDRLITLPVSDKIWEQNYPYPKSKKNTKTTNFFKEENQFYSYFVNKLPSYSLTHIKISSIVWSHQKELLSSDINSGPGINLNFSYALNSYENKNGSFNFIVNTLFGARTSFFKPERTLTELACINLAFDIYELNRHYLISKITASMTLEDVKRLSDKTILDARVMTTLMFEESMFGFENENFNYWKTKIHNELVKYIPKDKF